MSYDKYYKIRKEDVVKGLIGILAFSLIINGLLLFDRFEDKQEKVDNIEEKIVNVSENLKNIDRKIDNLSIRVEGIENSTTMFLLWNFFEEFDDNLKVSGSWSKSLSFDGENDFAEAES